MSKTVFTHEILPDGTSAYRVTLTLDAAETAALGEVAGVAVDASVLLADMVPESTLANAEAILAWASRASLALAAREDAPDAKE